MSSIQVVTDRAELISDAIGRRNKVIGLHTFDRGCETCVFATPFCRVKCYKWKAYHAWRHNLIPRDLKNQTAWEALDGESFGEWLRSRVKPVDRFRFCSRGEPFAGPEDVDRVADVVACNPSVLFWIPTRAWHCGDMRQRILRQVRALPNARVQASVDPSDSSADIRSLDRGGWSTMYFGRDGNDGRRSRTMCRKTWFHDVRCSSCGVCFDARQKHVHLKQHT